MPKTKGKNADKMSVNSENISTTKQKQLHKNPVYTLEVGIIGGGLDIVIIINNRGVEIIGGGWTGLKK